MFSQHVSNQLSAYCQGELRDDEARLVAEHLLGCQLCRHELEEIKLGISAELRHEPRFVVSEFALTIGGKLITDMLT